MSFVSPPKHKGEGTVQKEKEQLKEEEEKKTVKKKKEKRSSLRPRSKPRKTKAVKQKKKEGGKKSSKGEKEKESGSKTSGNGDEPPAEESLSAEEASDAGDSDPELSPSDQKLLFCNYHTGFCRSQPPTQTLWKPNTLPSEALLNYSQNSPRAVCQSLCHELSEEQLPCSLATVVTPSSIEPWRSCSFQSQSVMPSRTSSVTSIQGRSPSRNRVLESYVEGFSRAALRALLAVSGGSGRQKRPMSDKRSKLSLQKKLGHADDSEGDAHAHNVLDTITGMTVLAVSKQDKSASETVMLASGGGADSALSVPPTLVLKKKKRHSRSLSPRKKKSPRKAVLNSDSSDCKLAQSSPRKAFLNSDSSNCKLALSSPRKAFLNSDSSDCKLALSSPRKAVQNSDSSNCKLAQSSPRKAFLNSDSSNCKLALSSPRKAFLNSDSSNCKLAQSSPRKAFLNSDSSNCKLALSSPRKAFLTSDSSNCKLAQSSPKKAVLNQSQNKSDVSNLTSKSPGDQEKQSSKTQVKKKKDISSAPALEIDSVGVPNSSSDDSNSQANIRKNPTVEVASPRQENRNSQGPQGETDSVPNAVPQLAHQSDGDGMQHLSDQQFTPLTGKPPTGKKPAKKEPIVTWEVVSEKVPGEQKVQFCLRKVLKAAGAENEQENLLQKLQASDPEMKELNDSVAVAKQWRHDSDLGVSLPRAGNSENHSSASNTGCGKKTTGLSQRHKKKKLGGKYRATKSLSEVFRLMRAKGCLVNNCKQCGGVGYVENRYSSGKLNQQSSHPGKFKMKSPTKKLEALGSRISPRSLKEKLGKETETASSEEFNAPFETNPLRIQEEISRLLRMTRLSSSSPGSLEYMSPFHNTYDSSSESFTDDDEEEEVDIKIPVLLKKRTQGNMTREEKDKDHVFCKLRPKIQVEQGHQKAMGEKTSQMAVEGTKWPASSGQASVRTGKGDCKDPLFFKPKSKGQAEQVHPKATDEKGLLKDVEVTKEPGMELHRALEEKQDKDHVFCKIRRKEQAEHDDHKDPQAETGGKASLMTADLSKKPTSHAEVINKTGNAKQEDHVSSNLGQKEQEERNHCEVKDEKSSVLPVELRKESRLPTQVMVRTGEEKQDKDHLPCKSKPKTQTEQEHYKLLRNGVSKRFCRAKYALTLEKISKKMQLIKHTSSAEEDSTRKNDTHADTNQNLRILEAKSGEEYCVDEKVKSIKIENGGKPQLLNKPLEKKPVTHVRKHAASPRDVPKQQEPRSKSETAKNGSKEKERKIRLVPLPVKAYLHKTSPRKTVTEVSPFNINHNYRPSSSCASSTSLTSAIEDLTLDDSDGTHSPLIEPLNISTASTSFVPAVGEPGTAGSLRLNSPPIPTAVDVTVGNGIADNSTGNSLNISPTAADSDTSCWSPLSSVVDPGTTAPARVYSPSRETAPAPHFTVDRWVAENSPESYYINPPVLDQLPDPPARDDQTSDPRPVHRISLDLTSLNTAEVHNPAKESPKKKRTKELGPKVPPNSPTPLRKERGLSKRLAELAQPRKSRITQQYMSAGTCTSNEPPQGKIVMSPTKIMVQHSLESESREEYDEAEWRQAAMEVIQRRAAPTCVVSAGYKFQRPKKRIIGSVEGFARKHAQYVKARPDRRPEASSHLRTPSDPQLHRQVPPKKCSPSSPRLYSSKSRQLHASSSPQLHSPRTRQLLAPSSPQLHSPRTRQLHASSSPQLHSPRTRQLLAPSSPPPHMPLSPQTRSPKSRQLHDSPSPQLLSPRSLYASISPRLNCSLSPQLRSPISVQQDTQEKVEVKQQAGTSVHDIIMYAHPPEKYPSAETNVHTGQTSTRKKKYNNPQTLENFARLNSDVKVFSNIMERVNAGSKSAAIKNLSAMSPRGSIRSVHHVGPPAAYCSKSYPDRAVLHAVGDGRNHGAHHNSAALQNQKNAQKFEEIKAWLSRRSASTVEPNSWSLNAPPTSHSETRPWRPSVAIGSKVHPGVTFKLPFEEEELGRDKPSKLLHRQADNRSPPAPCNSSSALTPSYSGIYRDNTESMPNYFSTIGSLELGSSTLVPAVCPMRNLILPLAPARPASREFIAVRPKPIVKNPFASIARMGPPYSRQQARAERRRIRNSITEQRRLEAESNDSINQQLKRVSRGGHGGGDFSNNHCPVIRTSPSSWQQARAERRRLRNAIFEHEEACNSFVNQQLKRINGGGHTGGDFSHINLPAVTPTPSFNITTTELGAPVQSKTSATSLSLPSHQHHL